MLDEEEYSRWIRSALSSARGDLEKGDYNWACFKAQQAAEFVVRGLFHGLGFPAYGRSVSKLFECLPESLSAECPIWEARVLDRYYIPIKIS
ncbi:MAG: HEPN domain-containing protein [Candidatus Jordarchaeales archaeon]